MPSGFEDFEGAVGHVLVHVLAYRQWRDHVISALQDEGWGFHISLVGAVIRKEGDPGEIFGYFNVTGAKA